MANNPYSWSTTAASNANTDGIIAAEGMDPGKVNDDTRQVMASVAAFIKDNSGVIVAGGSANAITVTANCGFSSLANGLVIVFKASNDNSGATTLNVNAIGAKSVRKMTVSGDAALTGGEIQDDGIYIAHYSEDANSAAGGWILVNPTIIGGAVSGTTGTFSSTLSSIQLDITSSNPVINLTDTDTNADCRISGNSANGTLFLGADINNEASNSAIQFSVDGSVMSTYAPNALHIGKTSGAIGTAGVSLFTSGLGQFTVSNDIVGQFNRSNDGVIVEWMSAATAEGSVSISGTTTAYNTFMGAHWSQLADGSNPDILRGTVVESIDALAAWKGETNIHLPRFKVSDTPASNRVYGVFGWWDEQGDATIAALGAYLVRVIPGANVQIGDLLESNGDGCARVQADGIFRASTIAKVTSTTVAETYPDGSYLVPCTLHAG